MEQRLEYTFGIIGWYIKIGDVKRAVYWQNKFESLLDNEVIKQLNTTDIKVYRDAYLCYYITLEKKHRIAYGKKALKSTELIVKNNPDNIPARILMGNIYMNMPFIFGGSKSKALVNFKYAVDVIETQNDTNQNWFYIYALLKIAEIYKKDFNIKEYDFYINKLLKTEPSISPDVINSIAE